MTKKPEEAPPPKKALPRRRGRDARTRTRPDDALGLYLRQMGAIPLLNRDQELALARRLEMRRRRYRHAALVNWRTLEEVVKVFERVLADECALDPTIDVVKTLGLSRDEILKRMPHNVKHAAAPDRDGRRRLPRPASAPARPRRETACAATSTAGCARRSCWPRSCRRASTCSTAGSTSWRSSPGRWPSCSTRSTAAAAPPPTANAAPS